MATVTITDKIGTKTSVDYDEITGIDCGSISFKQMDKTGKDGFRKGTLSDGSVTLGSGKKIIVSGAEASRVYRAVMG